MLDDADEVGQKGGMEAWTKQQVYGQSPDSVLRYYNSTVQTRESLAPARLKED